MVARKLYTEKKKKEPALHAPEPKKVKRGLDITSYADAIVDGKLTVPLGSQVIIPRFRSGREVLSTGYIHKVEDDGSVHFWDETNAQWFVFKLTDAVVVKVSDRASSGT